VRSMSDFDVIVIGGGSFGGVLAHRLFQLDSRLRQHRILVLEGGCLVEQGTHAELIARGGVYSRLYETSHRGA